MQKVSEFKIVSASEGGGVLGGTLGRARKNEVCGIGRNPRHAGRKAHMVHQCDACEIVFFDARALAEHKRRKNHKDQE